MSDLTLFIPAYNAAAWIRDTLESVFSQTWSDFDVLVIDDGSTDETAELVASFRHPRLNLVRNLENLGVARTRNVALSRTTTKWLACLDADDLACPDRLMVQMRYLADHPDVAVLGALGEYFDGREGLAVYPVGEQAVAERMPFDNPMMQNTVILNVPWLRERGLQYDPGMHYAEDYDFWAQIYEAGGQIVNLPNVLVRYRFHAQSASRSKREEQELTATRIRRRLFAHLGCQLTDEQWAMLATYQFTGSLHPSRNALRQFRTIWQALAPLNRSQYEQARFICSALPRPEGLADKLKLALCMVRLSPVHGTSFVVKFLCGKG
jgi:GT2 family glycosyltransferase